MSTELPDKFNTALDILIAAHDGDVALLWLYLQRSGSFCAEDAARALCRTSGEISSAYEKLSRCGLAGEAAFPVQPKQEKLPPPDELPEYSSEDIIRRSREDNAFSAVVAEAQRALGHLLSTPDMKKLFGIYDYLAMPPEVIMMLLNYCVSASRAPGLEGRRPSMHRIEKEAFSWARQGILTLELAEEHIQAAKQRRESMAQIGELLGIRGRKLSEKESSYIGEWLAMGFPAESVAEAYERTVLNTGGMKWPYMNKILSNWHRAGIHSPAEIAEKDPSHRPGNGPGAAPPVSTKDLDDVLNSI